MFILLGWLWERAIKLYEWFGPKYEEYRDTVHNIFRDAVNLANRAYNDAVNWASRQVAWLLGILDSVGSGFIAILDSVAAAIYKWAEGKFASFLAWVNAIKNEILTWALSAVNQAREDAHKWVAKVRDDLWNISRGWLDGVIAWAAPVVLLYHAIVDLLLIFTPTNRARFVDFLSRGYIQVHDFFSDPREFIYSRLESTFFSFLCFILAQAIGSTKHDIPKTFSYKGE